MNSRSISFRLVAWRAAISLFMCVGFGLYVYFGLSYFLQLAQTDTLHRRTHEVAAILAAHVGREGEGYTIGALPHVFERFFRAGSVRTHSINGAGLGLSIVRSICLAHGGTVEADNRPMGGCRITVRLPLPAAGYAVPVSLNGREHTA